MNTSASPPPLLAAAAGDQETAAALVAGGAGLSHLLAAVRSVGVWGVLNAPTTGLLTGPVRAALESAGLGSEDCG